MLQHMFAEIWLKITANVHSALMTLCLYSDAVCRMQWVGLTYDTMKIESWEACLQAGLVCV